MFRWLLLLAVLLSALIGLVVGVLNPDPVTLDLGVFTPSLPLGAMLLLGFGAGVAVGMLLFWLMFDLPARLGRRRSAHSLPGSELRPRNE